MFRKFIAGIKPHIIPETILLFKVMLPFAMLFSFIFCQTNAADILKPWLKLFLLGTLYSLIGLILMRIVAFFVKRVLTGIPVAQGDIHQEIQKVK